MSRVLDQLQSGDLRSLCASFLYFDTGFTVWLLIGPLAPYIGPQLHLPPAAMGFLVATPVLSGALLRVPLGQLYQAWDGRKIAFMGIFLSALPPLYLLTQPFAPSLALLSLLGVLLGVGGASFAVALPMAGSGYAPQVQGLVLGLAAAGNIGAVLDGVLFPPLARAYGWPLAIAAVLPLLAMAALVMAAWGRDYAPKAGSVARGLAAFAATAALLGLLVLGILNGWFGVTGHPAILLLPLLGIGFVVTLLPAAQRKVLRQFDSWAFFLIYAITFGGFVGMSAYIAVLLIALYHIPKIDAGLLMAALAFTGATIRPLGGLLADRFTGPRALRYALSGIALVDLLFAFAAPARLPGVVALFLLYVCFGVGNGAAFQIVPMRWPDRRGLMTGLIGAAGGIGGFYIPVILGIAKQQTMSYRGGFAIFASLAIVAALVVQARADAWIRHATHVRMASERTSQEMAIEGD